MPCCGSEIGEWPKAREFCQFVRNGARYLADVQKEYRLHERLGSGTYGAVFRACGRNGLVAVKVTAGEADTASEVMYHSVAAQCPAVVPIIDHWTAYAYTVVVMPQCDGDLSRAMRNLPEGLCGSQAASFGRQLWTAVAFLHSRHILHRDIHGGNILVDSGPGNTLKVFLSDFGRASGIAHDKNVVVPRHVRPPEIFFGRGARLKVVDEFQGKFAYKRPGEVDYGVSVDVWPAAACWHYACCGEYPFGITECDAAEADAVKNIVFRLGFPKPTLSLRLGWNQFFEGEGGRVLRLFADKRKISIRCLSGPALILERAVFIYNPNLRFDAARLSRGLDDHGAGLGSDFL